MFLLRCLPSSLVHNQALQADAWAKRYHKAMMYQPERG